MSGKDNILVIKLGALGDFIQALGPMKSIRAHHPRAHITLLTTKPFEDFSRRSGYVDEVKLDQRPKWHQPLKWLALKNWLNSQNFSRVYDLQNNDRTGLYFKLLSAPKPEWVGIAKGASHRNTSPDRTKSLAFYGHKKTLALAGIENVEIDPLDWIESDLGKFGLKDPYILIVPGSAPTRPLKRWPVEHYAALCNKLVSGGYQPVLIGTDNEKETTAQITAACPQALDLTGKTSLYDLAALGRGAKACITNDTGPAHMIAPTGCPTLTLFSNDSNPVRHAPLGAHVKTLQENNLEDLGVEKVYQAFSESIDGA